MSYTFIDTHAHTYGDAFNDDLDAVVKRTQAAQVAKVLLPNIDMNSIDDMFRLCDAYPDHFYPMVGLHPCSVKANYKEELEGLRPYLDDPRVIAVGEMGTDLYWDKTFVEEQKDAFRIQVDWAKEKQLPIVIHCRESIDMTIDLVSELQDGHLSGVFHCFGGSVEQAERIVDLGFYLGLGGVSTFKKSTAIREMIATLPEDRILLETDAPYLTPHPHRGKRNESSYIPLIGETVAGAREVSVEYIAKVTTNNAVRLFGM